MQLTNLRQDILRLADPQHQEALQRFFKTGKGQYGEGDVFVGLNTPNARFLVKKYKNLPIQSIKVLLRSKIHEERAIALSLLDGLFARGTQGEKEKIYQLYLASTRYINNWDLVDISAPKIVGEYLLKTDPKAQILNQLAKSQNLWERRIAILATFAFIRAQKFAKTVEIAKILLADKQDLIHKASGWMLREVGKSSRKKEEEFLKKYSPVMPRTMLRYAIEKFPPTIRQKYLRGKVVK